MPVDDILLNTEEKMQKSEEVVVADLTGVRTGKASPALVENINIEAYEGSSMRLKELAAITTPEMRTLVIQPWDAPTIHAIEKGIQAANLGLNPSVDGKLIRISLPDLSKERRQEMVKSARKLAEDGRVSIRHVRREAIETLKTEQKAGDITEDDLSLGEKEVQKLTDAYVKKVDEHLTAKEEDILTV